MALSAGEFEKSYKNYTSRVERSLHALIKQQQPASVYGPIRYVLRGGGKRIRAVLVILSCEAVGGVSSQALHAATAIEILHNFTLVHDDVMDNAGVRRGRPTVHRKWNHNVAILAGDQMIAYAYRSLMKTRSPMIGKMMNIFTDAFVDVCDGQGFDKEFESQSDVSLHQYLSMIRKKTARIISASAEIGALAGEGTSRQVSALKTFGEELGMAFQIQDDLLDIAGDEMAFGKAIGGDIVEKKKTYLLLTALQRVRGNDRRLLRSLMRRNGITPKHISRVRDIYLREGVVQSAHDEIARRTRKAKNALAPLHRSRHKTMLLWLADKLLERQH